MSIKFFRSLTVAHIISKFMFFLILHALLARGICVPGRLVLQGLGLRDLRYAVIIKAGL